MMKSPSVLLKKVGRLSLSQQLVQPPPVKPTTIDLSSDDEKSLSPFKLKTSRNNLSSKCNQNTSDQNLFEDNDIVSRESWRDFDSAQDDNLGTCESIEKTPEKTKKKFTLKKPTSTAIIDFDSPHDEHVGTCESIEKTPEKPKKFTLKKVNSTSSSYSVGTKDELGDGIFAELKNLSSSLNQNEEYLSATKRLEDNLGKLSKPLSTLIVSQSTPDNSMVVGSKFRLKLPKAQHLVAQSSSFNSSSLDLDSCSQSPLTTSTLSPLVVEKEKLDLPIGTFTNAEKSTIVEKSKISVTKKKTSKKLDKLLTKMVTPEKFNSTSSINNVSK